MSELTPSNTTVGDLCTAALQECGRLGVGQTALAEDTIKTWSRLQWMLQQWERKRWLVYHLVTYSKVSTGQQSYTFGPGGEIDTNQVPSYGLGALTIGAGSTGFANGDTIQLVANPLVGAASTPATITVLSQTAGVITSVGITNPGVYSGQLPTAFAQGVTSGAGTGSTWIRPTWQLLSGNVTGAVASVRPAKLESAYLRQIQNPSPNQVDYQMQILQSMEDYNSIGLKMLSSFPGAVFLDSQWPLGNLFCYPVPQATIYQIFVSVMEQLPTSFPTLATRLNLPHEYYAAILYNLALRLRLLYQVPSFSGDPLVAMAKDSLAVLRGANTQIGRLQMPAELTRSGIYNIFSDKNY